ncbi:MAG: zinc-finger domain-containing protein [Pseudomonadota bacterium]
MPNPYSAEADAGGSAREPNAQNHYNVTRADLPLHCPLAGMSLWNSHPRVYLPIEATGRAKCPYCGAEYTLVDAG